MESAGVVVGTGVGSGVRVGVGLGAGTKVVRNRADGSKREIVEHGHMYADCGRGRAGMVAMGRGGVETIVA